MWNKYLDIACCEVHTCIAYTFIIIHVSHVAGTTFIGERNVYQSLQNFAYLRFFIYFVNYKKDDLESKLLNFLVYFSC